MPAEEAATSDRPKQNGWRALLRARRRREKREKRQEMMINHKPSLFRWPTRALPAVAGCRTEPHKPCCVSCDQNVGSHLVLDLGARLLATRSAFQAIEVFDTEAFGHVMTIDGDLQLTELDECHYHEMMVHVPLASRPPGAGAPRVLIIGGGDGGCAREALRWPGATVTLVDIDAAVLDAARRFFPACAVGLDDPRTEVHVSDGAAFAAAAAARGDTYDLVICDSTDCSAAERASGTLYTDAFLVSVAALVAPGGFFCRNYTSSRLCGNRNFTARSSAPDALVDFHTGLLWNTDEAAATLPRYAAHFAYASPFVWMQPTYSSGSYSALLCGGTEPSERDLAAIAATLGETDYWTPAVHKAAFALPAFVARRMSPSAPPAPPNES